ncbi:1,3-beta-glucan synthase subunit FKS1-like, domain-1 [Sesbania bispinosa]|nr:1,3-beta-glucan synthase subunit FKS1-like, domain-1 [Sesbania bispinosa]
MCPSTFSLGKATNLRLAPKCIYYIFHNMVNKLNKILEDYMDENTGQPLMPSIFYAWRVFPCFTWLDSAFHVFIEKKNNE